MANLRDLIVNGVTKFIGKAYAQTPPQGTSDTQIATTEFVSNFPFRGYTPPLFSMQQSTVKLNDIQWLRSDTFSWQDGTLYEAAYNKLVEEYNSNDKAVLVNADPVRTLNITDQGVASGFSNSKYLSKTITLSSDRTAVFPMVFDITTGSDVATEQYISSIATWCMQLSIGTDSKLKLYLGSGSAWDIANGTSGSTVLKANNKYEIEIDYNGTVYTVKLTDLTSTTLTVTTDIEVTSSTMICTGSRTLLLGTDGGHTIPFLGSIDVANCQVDEAWKGVFGYRTQNDFFIVGPEQEFYCLQKYNLDGIAWYFILDTANTRFKLPRTKWGFKGLRDQAGNEISESLPNIKGSWTGAENNTVPQQGTGAITWVNAGGGYSGNYGGARGSGFDFNASAYDSTYQDGAHVQEKGTQVYTYFYVGEWTKTAVENTAGIINGSNLSAQGRSYFSGFAMPSTKYVTITAGAVGSTYTAPANGWFYMKGVGTTTFCFLALIAITESGDELYSSEMVVYQVGNGLATLLPVKKGQVIKINYQNANISKFQFYYAEGENN